MSNKNEVFEYLIDQLRQQVDNNQCEDLAHEVQSLKNQLRDASAQIKELHLALVKATGDAEAYKLICKQEQSGCRKEDGRECDHDWYFYDKGASMMCKKCGVRKECEHSWIIMPGLFLSEGNPNNVPGSELCCKCGKREWDVKGHKPKDDTQECSHNWRFVNGKAPAVCINCGITKSSKCEHEWQFYGVGFPCMCIKCGLKK